MNSTGLRIVCAVLCATLAMASYAQEPAWSPSAVLNPSVTDTGSKPTPPANRGGAVSAPSQRHAAQPFSQSPYANVHHRDDGPVYRHPRNHINVAPQDGVSYWVVPNGVYWVNQNPAPEPVRVWVPGCYVWQERTVWVPGQWYEEYIPPVYERRIADGREVLVLVAAERIERYFVPAHYETVQEQVWVPGHWEYVW